MKNQWKHPTEKKLLSSIGSFSYMMHFLLALIHSQPCVLVQREVNYGFGSGIALLISQLNLYYGIMCKRVGCPLLASCRIALQGVGGDIALPISNMFLQFSFLVRPSMPQCTLTHKPCSHDTLNTCTSCVYMYICLKKRSNVYSLYKRNWIKIGVVLHIQLYV